MLTRIIILIRRMITFRFCTSGRVETRISFSHSHSERSNKRQIVSMEREREQERPNCIMIEATNGKLKPKISYIKIVWTDILLLLHSIALDVNSWNICAETERRKNGMKSRNECEWPHGVLMPLYTESSVYDVVAAAAATFSQVHYSLLISYAGITS